MNKATARQMPVRFAGSNSRGEYYKVNGAFNVIYGANRDHPLVCLDCRSNKCDHTEAVEDHLSEHGVTA